MIAGVTVRYVSGLLALALSTGIALGEEKNGLMVNVTKKTLERADTRNGPYYYDRIDRTQGLKATIRNNSLKPMPEGTVKWTILVRKWGSNSIYSYAGSEALKALKPSEMTEMTIGAAPIGGWRDYNDQYKDKLEWQIVVEQAGKEMMKMGSTSSFDVLLKRATPIPQKPAQ